MCNAYNHPPDCTCGFGGDGHLGGGFHGDFRCASTGQATAYPVWRGLDEFCHPTTCPMCHASVYFIRHNGGSVWVDELGWPWPKHGCFGDSLAYRAFEPQTADGRLPLTEPLLGVIYQLQSQSLFEPNVTIVDHRKRAHVLGTPDEVSAHFRPGDLVWFSVRDRILRIPNGPDVDVHPVINSPHVSPWNKCPHCNTWVECSLLPDHAEHCKLLQDRKREVARQRKLATHAALQQRRNDQMRSLQVQVARIVGKMTRRAWASIPRTLSDEQRRRSLAQSLCRKWIGEYSKKMRGDLERYFVERRWRPLWEADPYREPVAPSESKAPAQDRFTTFSESIDIGEGELDLTKVKWPPSLPQAAKKARPLKSLHLSQPFSVRHIAKALNVQPRLLIAELLKQKILVRADDPIEEHMVRRLIARHGFQLPT